MTIDFRPLYIATVSDAAQPWQLGSQEAASPIMKGIIQLHYDICHFLLVILVFVSRLMVRAFWLFRFPSLVPTTPIVQSTSIEMIRTLLPSIIPMFIAIPSFALVYSLDEIVDPLLTIKAIGHQWYRIH